MQANVGTGVNAQNLALQIAHENNINNFFVTEPYTLKDFSTEWSITQAGLLNFPRQNGILA